LKGCLKKAAFFYWCKSAVRKDHSVELGRKTIQQMLKWRVQLWHMEFRNNEEASRKDFLKISLFP